MPFEDALTLEYIKAGLTFVIVIILGGIIAALWNARQKRRELDLLALGKLYDSYGKFIAIRRIWNEIKKNETSNKPIPEQEKSRLLDLANELEGGVESILLRVTSEKRLEPEEQANLGRFRQSFQALRESIRDDKKLEFGLSEHPQYVALKEGTLFVSSIFNKMRLTLPPSLEDSKAAFKEITSNKWENKT